MGSWLGGMTQSDVDSWRGKNKRNKRKLVVEAFFPGALERGDPGQSCQLSFCPNKTGCGGFRAAWRTGDRSHLLGTETCQQCRLSAEKRHGKKDCDAGRRQCPRDCCPHIPAKVTGALQLRHLGLTYCQVGGERDERCINIYPTQPSGSHGFMRAQSCSYKKISVSPAEKDQRLSLLGSETFSNLLHLSVAPPSCSVQIRSPGAGVSPVNPGPG